jgi:hypothetical protein
LPRGPSAKNSRRTQTPSPTGSPHTVSLNRLLLVSFQHFPLPGLVVVTFGQESPGVDLGDCRTADVIENDRDTAAVE